MRHVSVQQLSAFVDGALVGVSRELVTRHLATCAGCRQRQVDWSGTDEALRRVLSWEPDERTFEEWSSRVEMTITAERKGLPPPEFSEQHHPVIASAHEPDVDRVNSAVQSAQRARLGESSPAPAAPQTPPVAPHVAQAPPAPITPPAAKPKPAAKAKPREPERAIPQAIVTPAPELASPPKPVATPAPLPAPALAEPMPPAPVAFVPTPEPVLEPAPPPSIVASEPPKPVVAPAPEPVMASAPRASGYVPPWSEIALPEPPRPSPSVRLRAYEQSLRQSEASLPPSETRAAKRARLRRRKFERPLLAVLSVILLALLVGSPLVPEVIRIPLPDRWRWRLPRVEFVRHGKRQVPPQIASADLTQLAVRTVVEPELVPPKPIPVPVESTTAAKGAADSIAVMEAKPATQSSLSITTPRAKPVKKKRPPPEPEPEPEVLTWPESPGTIIPTRVTTAVTAADGTPVPARTPVLGQTTAAPPKPAPKPAPPASVESEADWPLLCGIVVDGAGEPFEGVLVVLPVNALSVRTDRRGRFCVACPPGSQPLRVEAPGQKTYMRTVELASGVTEIRVSLTPE